MSHCGDEPQAALLPRFAGASRAETNWTYDAICSVGVKKGHLRGLQRLQGGAGSGLWWGRWKERGLSRLGVAWGRGREMRNGLAKGRGGSGRWRGVSVGTWDLLSSSRGVFTQTFIFQVTSHLVRWQDVPPPT